MEEEFYKLFKGVGLIKTLIRNIFLSNREFKEPSKTKPIQLDECIGCGLCALACPFGAIRVDGVALKCNGCYKRDVEICKEVCPTGAINNLEEILNNKLTTTLDKFSKLYAIYGRG